MSDDLALLTGPEVRDVLSAALAAADEQLVAWRVRSVDHRPGRGTTAAYDARVRGPAGEGTRLLAAATGAAVGGAPRVMHMSTGGRDLTVWRFPDDPGLPALPTAATEGPVRVLLDSFGVAAGPVEVRVRSYRPGRRAVLEVRTPEASLFLKVLRPHLAGELHRRHVLLRDAGLPVPRSLGCTDEGLVVLEALGGTSLRARLREGAVPDLPGEALLELLRALPAQLCELPRRRSWSDDADHYARVVAAALPDEAERCRQLAARVRDAPRTAADDEPVHGDLYEAQLLLDGNRISGLLDLDGAGPGRRVDDLACVLAHLAVLAQVAPERAVGAPALLARWRADFSRAVDPAELRARTAGVVLSLATGPHRVQSADWPRATRSRLDLAEQELEGC